MAENTAGRPEEVKTRSRFRAWWLSKFKGYRVKLIVNGSPRVSMFGRVKYDNLWILTPPGR